MLTIIFSVYKEWIIWKGVIEGAVSEKEGDKWVDIYAK
jgi:hypothetical protein